MVAVRPFRSSACSLCPLWDTQGCSPVSKKASRTQDSVRMVCSEDLCVSSHAPCAQQLSGRDRFPTPLPTCTPSGVASLIHGSLATASPALPLAVGAAALVVEGLVFLNARAPVQLATGALRAKTE
jgi:hypothetical protein